MRRFLILLANTGGGHRATADALQAEILRQQPGSEIIGVDFLGGYTFWPLTESDLIYSWLVESAPWAWAFLWWLAEGPLRWRILRNIARPILSRHVFHLFDTTQPDVVIAVHPLTIAFSLPILRRWTKKRGHSYVPFVSVVTDLGSVHTTWLYPKVDRIYLPTQESYHKAIQFHFRPEQCRVYGLPIRTTFSQSVPDKAVLLRQLGLDPSLPTLLLMGGGQGMGPLAAIAQAVAKARPPAQLVVVVGRNPKLHKNLMACHWPIPTRVLGFVEDIHLWMHSADLLITKAGPGTIAEAFVCGLPLLLTGYVPGQEEDNVSYVLSHGVGVYHDKPAEIARQVQIWLAGDTSALRVMGERARQLAKPEATRRIVQDILAGIWKA